MRKAVAKATMVVMGLFAYLILSITLYQNAMAAPLGAGEAQDILSIGFTYDMYTEGSDTDKLASFMIVTQAIQSAIATHAMQDCTVENEVDYSCTETRIGMLLAIFAKATTATYGSTTNEDMVNLFWSFSKKMEFDRSVRIPFAVSIFVRGFIDAGETTS